MVIQLSEGKEAVSISEKFWNASIAELKQGYNCETEGQALVFNCLVCGEHFEKGIIYKDGDRYYEAERFAALHVDRVHGGMFTWLLTLDKKLDRKSVV